MTDRITAERVAHGVPLAGWLAYWRALRRYLRYEVVGLEKLDLPTAALIVGYHGRPAAYDSALLTVEIFERSGYLPHGIFHSSYEKNRFTNWILHGLGGVCADDASLERAVEKGEHIITVPGGTREGMRSFRQRYEVDWGERTGYLRLAAKYRIPIVPVGASGVDDAYVGLNNGYVLGKRVGMPAKMPLWFAVGLGGPWPFSLPFPVKIRQIVGEPITVTADGGIDPNNPEELLAVHRQVAATVQTLIDCARGGNLETTRQINL